ncbi:hypothetical protein HNV26_20620 [Myxococcus xanthus]|nr:hypothetical protein [Myxococcus xanthus]
MSERGPSPHEDPRTLSPWVGPLQARLMSLADSVPAHLPGGASSLIATPQLKKR